jgi:hypothetical protein
MKTPAADFAALADEALSTDRIAVGWAGGQYIMAVPDVVLAEGLANGKPTPESLTVERADGRTVTFYRMPWVQEGAT